MNLVTGTYTGTGTNDTQRIALSFRPDTLIIGGDTTQEVFVRKRTSWHGRTQSLYDNASEYAIGPYHGQPWQPFRGLGFSVTGNANLSGTVYHYLAIEDSNGEAHKSTSWIGNATAARLVAFLDSTPAVGLVKRDSAQPGQWRVSGAASAVASTFQGGTNAHLALASTGFTLSNSSTVNENDNTSLGEACEGIAFYEGDGFELVTWTGDGDSDHAQALGVSNAIAAIVLDLTNNVDAATDYHVFVTDTMDAGDAKPLAPLANTTGVVTSLSGSTLTFAGTNFNESGRTYAALVFRSVTSTYVQNQPALSGASNAIQPARGSGHVELANTTLSGACTLEWYGQPRFTETYASTQPWPLIPLFLMGNGPRNGTLASNAGTYNGGLFLYSTDPNSNGWQGLAARWVHTHYMSDDKDENSINYYSLNSGVTFRSGDDTHFMLTHDGSGKWRMYLDSKLIKEFNLNIDQATYGNRTNGGSGNDLETTLGAVLNTTYGDQSDTLHYRAAYWTTALTDAQVESRYRNSTAGEAYVGTAPTADYDFRATGAASGATGTSTSVVSRTRALLDSEMTQRWVTAAGQTGGTGTQTFTSVIPSAGRYLVAVAAWSTDVTALTISGVSATEIGTAEATAGNSITWWWADVTAAGNVVATLNNATPAACGLAVWDMDGLTPDDAVQEGFNNAGPTAVPVTLTTATAGMRLFACGLKVGTPRSAPQFIRGDLQTDGRANIGSTSAVVGGSGFATGSDQTAIAYFGGDGTTVGLVSVIGLTAIPATPSAVQTAIRSSVLSAIKSMF